MSTFLHAKHAILAALAFFRSKPVAKSVPAIFLDRDGTINVDHGYVHEIDNFEFIDGVIDAMRELKEMGYALVLVTNQSGIARGKFTEAQFETLTEWMDWSLADRGVDLDGIYYCPHHPQGAVEEYRQTCDCRKPHPGMLIPPATICISIWLLLIW
jgi:D-glycero-D-manno-heptose 1,7-bisphosphate phosphatase